MTSDVPTNADDESEAEFTPGTAARLGHKRAAGGALIRDVSGRVLFVEPTYKPYLEMPGGSAERNESPRQACVREVKEELGLDLTPTRLLVVDWMPTDGVWPDGFVFVFDFATITPQALESISLQRTELHGYRMIDPDRAKTELRPQMYRRLLAALRASENATVEYLEFGH